MQTTVSSLNRKGKEQVEFLGGRSESGRVITCNFEGLALLHTNDEQNCCHPHKQTEDDFNVPECVEYIS